jgi:hypothetical protein
MDRASAQRALAWLKQEREQVDPTQGKITLAELCDRYLQTAQHHKPRTVERKTCIVGRIKRDWATGKSTQVARSSQAIAICVVVSLASCKSVWFRIAQSPYLVHQRSFRVSCRRQNYSSLAGAASALCEARKTNPADTKF